MHRMVLKIMAVALLMSLAAYGQSLGDIARENREKKNNEDPSAAQPRVITNKDLPKDPDADREPAETHSGASAAPSSEAADHRSADRRSADRRSAEQRLGEQRAAERWKTQILAQKNTMATLQARIDQLQASIQSANGSVQSEGPYNRYQARQLQRVAQLQGQLDEQQRKLDQMQEAARHAGMHTAVYDP
jgi:predicted RNase H-like nuclease (RuvC/YqgF family)